MVLSQPQPVVASTEPFFSEMGILEGVFPSIPAHLHPQTEKEIPFPPLPHCQQLPWFATVARCFSSKWPGALL